MIQHSVNRLASFAIVAGLAWAVAGCSGGPRKASANAAASARPAASRAANASSSSRTSAADPAPNGGMATDSASTGTSATAADPVKISSGRVSGLGTVLVNGSGHTLYVFEPDNRKKVTCTKKCPAVWPPVIVKSGQKPAASGAVKPSKLGSDPNPNPSGGRVVTYNGWPLYTYAADTKAGQANGQGLNVNGGLWYAISPAGQVIKKKP